MKMHALTEMLRLTGSKFEKPNNAIYAPVTYRDWRNELGHDLLNSMAVPGQEILRKYTPKEFITVKSGAIPIGWVPTVQGF